MKTTFLKTLTFLAALTLCVSCATGKPPFLSPEDYALKQQIKANLGEYYNRTLSFSVAGDRVYLGGTLDNYDDLRAAMDIIRGTKGVNEVLEHVELLEPGSPHDSSGSVD